MITAYQSATLKAASRLHEARESLFSIASLIVVNPNQAVRIHGLVFEIDKLFGEFIAGNLSKKERKFSKAKNL